MVDLMQDMSVQDMLDHLEYLGYLEKRVLVQRYRVAGVEHVRESYQYRSEPVVVRDTERGIDG